MLDGLARHRLSGAVLVLAGIAIAIVVLWPNAREDPVPAAAPASRIARVSVPPLGFAFSYPRTWKRTVDGRAIRLRSPEGSVLLTVSSPVTGQQPARVRDALRQQLRQRLAPTQLLREGKGMLGRRMAATFELTGRSGDGDRVRALGVVASTPSRTYAVTLITSAAPSRRRLQEAQAVLASVRLTKPR